MRHELVFELDEIAEPGARSFSVNTAAGTQEGFIIRYADQIRVYLNSCPHTGVSLNWADDQFFDVSHKFIQCSMHGALFEPLNGRCVWGPCLGESLQSVEFELVEQHLLIYI